MDREVPDLSGEVKTLSYEPVFVGPYSTVFRGKLKTSNELVAIKVLNPIHGAAVHTIRRKIERERRTWSVLCHPNIVPLYGFAEDEERFQPFGAFISPVSSTAGKQAHEIVKLCQWFQRGDLAQYLRDHGALAPHEERLKLWEGVVAGVAYLHGHNPILIHGDLKPRNILISEGGDALICDFGLARVCLEEGNSGMTTTTPHTGTERYLAYELFMAEEDAIPTTASDIYATGCIGLEIIFQEIPYSNHRGNNLRFYMLKEMQAGNPPAVCPQDLAPTLVRFWGLISWCWDRDPLSRPRAYNLSSHLAQVPKGSGTLDILDIATSSVYMATSDSHLRDNHLMPRRRPTSPPLLWHAWDTPPLPMIGTNAQTTGGDFTRDSFPAYVGQNEHLSSRLLYRVPRESRLVTRPKATMSTSRYVDSPADITSPPSPNSGAKQTSDEDMISPKGFVGTSGGVLINMKDGEEEQSSKLRGLGNLDEYVATLAAEGGRASDSEGGDSIYPESLGSLSTTVCVDGRSELGPSIMFSPSTRRPPLQSYVPQLYGNADRKISISEDVHSDGYHRRSGRDFSPLPVIARVQGLPLRPPQRVGSPLGFQQLKEPVSAKELGRRGSPMTRGKERPLVVRGRY